MHWIWRRSSARSVPAWDVRRCAHGCCLPSAVTLACRAALAGVSPRTGAPIAGLRLVLGLDLALLLLFGVAGTAPIDVFFYLATVGTLCLLCVYCDDERRRGRALRSQRSRVGIAAAARGLYGGAVCALPQRSPGAAIAVRCIPVRRPGLAFVGVLLAMMRAVPMVESPE